MALQNSEHTRPLLIVIDLQKGWRHKTATESAMLRAVEACKQFDGDIMHCCFRNDPSSLFHTQLKWFRFVEPSDTDEIPEAAALHLRQQWRTTYSCVDDETLPIFKQYSQVYIAGVFTDISVFMTAMHLFDYNIPVSVVTDCVATLHGDTAHKSALHSLGFAIGDRCLVAADSLPKTAQQVG